MEKIKIQYETFHDNATVWFRDGKECNPWLFMLVTTMPLLHETLTRLQTLYEDWSAEWMTETGRQYPDEPLPLLSAAEDGSDILFAPLPEQTVLDEHALTLVNEIHDRFVQLRKLGISVRTIRNALLQLQRPGRMLVTPNFRIILTDYNNLEVPFTPLTKALYILYLHHPEGIAFKQLSAHRAELLRIYALLTPTINPYRREQHIANLVDSTSNSLNEKVSIIRHTLARLLDEALLPFYEISGGKGEPHTIRLPRQLLTLNQTLSA